MSQKKFLGMCEVVFIFSIVMVLVSILSMSFEETKNIGVLCLAITTLIIFGDKKFHQKERVRDFFDMYLSGKILSLLLFFSMLISVYIREFSLAVACVVLLLIVIFMGKKDFESRSSNLSQN